MTDDRRQNSEDRIQKTEDSRWEQGKCGDMREL